MRAIILALLLAACASPSGEGQSTDWARNSFTDAADLGDGTWLVSCENAASACTARARAICANGFDTLDLGTQQNASGAVSQYGGGFGTRTDYRIRVRCK